MSTLDEGRETAERSVIGSIIQDTEALRVIGGILTAEDFADKRLGQAYETARGMWAEGAAIDELTLASRLASLPFKFSAVELFDMRHRTPTSANVEWYARLVADYAGKRRLGAFAHRVGALAETETPFADAMRVARSEWEAVGTAGGNEIHAPLLADVLDGVDDYDWLIPNLLERRDRLVITGSEGAGKTMWVQLTAVLAAAGIHPTTFTQIDPVKVLVVDAENSAKQWRRRIRPIVAKAARQGVADPAETMRLATVSRLDLTSERDLTAVHRLIDDHAPDILVIGPLYRLIPRAITSDDDAAPLLTALDSLRERGCALIMEAHAGHTKDIGGDRDLRPRGSSALMGWPEFGFGLRLLPPETEDPAEPVRAQLLRWRGDRDERAWPQILHRGGEWPWVDDDPGETARAYSRRYVGPHAP